MATEAEDAHALEDVGKKQPILKWVEPDSDVEVHDSFDVIKSWESLFEIKSCQRVMILEKEQKKLGLVVGIHVTQEFPWKQVSYYDLHEKLFDNIDNGEELAFICDGYGYDNPVLIGYAPLLTQNSDDAPEGDPFIFFADPDDARYAMNIIQNIELYERWRMNKRLVKRPRRWLSLGSENEINLTLQQRYLQPTDVEIQSVYPLTIPEKKEFSLRTTADVRDGYIELLPPEGAKFDIIARKRVTVGTQSAPQLVTVEQQTDPTFPTNAWAQYLFEVDEGDSELDRSTDDEREKDKHPPSSKPNTADAEQKLPKGPPVMSEQIIRLLNTLEFNQVDMYRNDYPQILQKEMEHYTTPHLEEKLCFANISKSFQRFVASVDWYNGLSGLLVASYTFNTPVTLDLVSEQVDAVQRAVLQPNPILMWSFADNLNYKLEFESPLEVTALSFSPYDKNLLFGGAKTGQIFVWDLQNRADHLDDGEILTTAQSRYRTLMADFLNWTIPVSENPIIEPVIKTMLEFSQKAAISQFYWLGTHYYINSFGKVCFNPDKNVINRYFMTSSVDGTITFWNWDGLIVNKQSASAASRRDMPKILTQSESVYKNKILKPVFTVSFTEPITAVVADVMTVRCTPLDSIEIRKVKPNFRIGLVLSQPTQMRQTVITSSFYGRIERLNWLGAYAEENREQIHLSTSFARVHDGPVIGMRRNPFYRDIFASIGRNILALWKEDHNLSPIFWRKRPCDLTAIFWSQARPAVLFVTRIDGNLEAWDILARDDDACLNDVLGGGIITSLIEHRLNDPEKLIGIGDYNSSFRLIKLPATFYEPLPDELERLESYISRELERKIKLQTWEQQYYENNKDIIEARREAEKEAHKEMERLEKEKLLNEARKAKEDEDARKAAPKQLLSYTERMRIQWDALNMKRMMDILMSRKRVDEKQLERDTALEKTRLRYEEGKLITLNLITSRMADELATVRARLLPTEVPDLRREDMVRSLVTNILSTLETYENIEDDLNEQINSMDQLTQLSYIEFMGRGEHRRKLLIKSLGGNTERQLWFENAVNEITLDECTWPYEMFDPSEDDLIDNPDYSERTSETLDAEDKVSVEPEAEE